MDNGAQVNTLMLRYVHEHSLEMGPITDLMGSKVACVGLGNTYTRPLGYVVIWVQVDGVWGYDEDQIALVIPDFFKLAARVLIILGMPTISLEVNVMRKAEMDTLAMPWANARAAHLLTVCRMMTIGIGNGLEEKLDANDYGSLMYTQKTETIEPFSSHIVPVMSGKAYVGEPINIMVQALRTEDGSLPLGLTIQNTYTELRKGSKKQLWWYRSIPPTHQTLKKKVPVARVVVASPVPEPPKGEKLEEKAGESHNSPTPALTVRQRHGTHGPQSWWMPLASSWPNTMMYSHWTQQS